MIKKDTIKKDMKKKDGEVGAVIAVIVVVIDIEVFIFSYFELNSESSNFIFM